MDKPHDTLSIDSLVLGIPSQCALDLFFLLLSLMVLCLCEGGRIDIPRQLGMQSHRKAS